VAVVARGESCGVGDFVGEARGYLNVRPRKLGYLVQSGNYEQLERAVVYATSEWGGYSQPILPVRRRNLIATRWWQFGQTLQPEFLIDYCGVSDSLRQRIKSELGAVVIDHPPPFDEPGVHTTVAHPRGSLAGRTLFVPPDRTTWGVKLALGIVRDEEREPWEALGAPIAQVASASEMLRAQTGQAPSPLELTRVGTSTFQTEGFMGSPVIVFTGKPSWWLLMTFWNVRAGAIGSFARSHVIFLPRAVLSDPEMGAELRDLCIRQRTRPDVIVVGMPREHVRALIEGQGFAHGEPRVTVPLMSNEPLARDLAEMPLTYLLNLDPREFAVGSRFEGVRQSAVVALTRPTTTVRIETPVHLNPILGNVRYDLQGFDALSWPASPGTARLIHESAEFTAYGLSFVGRPAAIFDRTLNLPSEPDVATAYLADQGWSWELSDKGIYGQALLAMFNRPLPSWSLSGLLAIAIVRSLATLRRHRAEQLLTHGGAFQDETLESMLRDLMPAIERRWRSSGEITSDVTASGTPARRPQVEPILSALVADQLVQRALRFRCSRCTLVQAIPFERVRDIVECEGCRLPSAIAGPKGREPEIVYAINTLLDRVIEQDCLGHVLAKTLVERLLGVVWVVPGALVRNLQEATEREVDLLGISRERLIVGEVKARSIAFTPDVVQDTINLASQLGATLVVLAAMDTWEVGSRQQTSEMLGVAGVEQGVYDLSDLTA
jgi:hypothetical protein